MFRNKRKTHVHFIGIGGIGMSGIAEILLRLGYVVSGSDIQTGATVERLKELGAIISIGHKASHVQGATVVVYSSAVKEDNPEFVEAQLHKIPLIRRAEMLAELMRLKYGIAVAGSHGKTTTTSILATILHEAGIDPTHIIGGVVRNLGGHAQVGKGEFLVAEADESDGSFLLLSPVLSIITNIDNDHLDHYGTEDKLISAFEEFANKIPFYGCCAINIQDPKLKEIRTKIKRPCVTYGVESTSGQDLNEEVDFLAKNIIYSDGETTFDLYHQGKFVQKIKIFLSGKHNVLNALGALAIAHQIEVPFSEMAKGIQKFKGVDRRFQTLLNNDKIEIIDDYAHHPTEIQSTITTLKQIRNNKVVVIFEPHRYSRTKICWKDFFHCFNLADEVYMSPIYPASEPEIEGITSKRLVTDISELHPGLIKYLDTLEDLDKFMLSMLGNEKITFLCLGAGTIGRRAREAVKTISEQTK